MQESLISYSTFTKIFINKTPARTINLMNLWHESLHSPTSWSEWWTRCQTNNDRKSINARGCITSFIEDVGNKNEEALTAGRVHYINDILIIAVQTIHVMVSDAANAIFLMACNNTTCSILNAQLPYKNFWLHGSFFIVLNIIDAWWSSHFAVYQFCWC